MTGPLDSFVGRDRELAALDRLLARRRLVTLVAPGGAGKTRLAGVLAANNGSAFPDGVCWVDLAAIGNGDRVAAAVADACGVPAVPGEPTLRTLGSVLAGRALLLVLDNCEHVLEACAPTVEALLGHCGRLRVLATSREELRVRGEQTFRLGELSLPRRPAPTAAEALASDAVRLFVERASAVDAGFALTDADASIAAEICRRLDGLPLAIELAARRVRLLGLAGVLDRLDARLGLLTAGRRTAGSRHRSLHSAIDWSYRLLEPAEQRVLRRLSVLAGTFTVDLATAVCADPDLPAETALDLLASLEAKSLLASGPADDGQVLLSQLESIRIFGRERLAQAGELDASYERLVATLTARIEPYLDEHPLTEARQPLAGDWPSVLAAAEWAGARRDDRYLVLVRALTAHWLERGHVNDARTLLTETVRDGTGPAAHLGPLLTELAGIAAAQGDFPEARRFADQAVTMERRLDRPVPLARALQAVAAARAVLGDEPAARAAYAEAIDLLRPVDGPVARATLLSTVVWAAVQDGEVNRAAAILDETLALTRAHGTTADLVRLLHTAGLLALEQNLFAIAEQRFAQALECVAGPLYVAECLEGLAMSLAERGRADPALRLVGRAAVVRHSVAAEPAPTWRSRVDGAVAHATRLVGSRRASAALASGARVPVPDVVACALTGVDALIEPPGAEPPGVERRGAERRRAGAAGRPPACPVPPQAGTCPVPLSEQEHVVSRLVVDGLTNAQIARRLGLSARTVATHLARARAKLGVRSRAQLAAFVVKGLG